MKPLFSNEPVNFERRHEVDLMKFLVILAMIFGHTNEMIFSYEIEDLMFAEKTIPVCIYWIFLKMTTATGFMFMMGMVMSYSRNQTAEHYFSRCWRLIVAWTALKLLNGFPGALRFAPHYDISMLQYMAEYLLESDILMFAGLFFLFMGIMKKLNASMPVIVLVSVLLFAISHFIPQYYENEYLSSFLGNFFITDYSYFPFFNWILLPVFGMCFGRLLRRCYDTNRLYAGYGLISLIVLVIGCVVACRTGVFSFDRIMTEGAPQEFYDMNLLTCIIALAGVGVYLSICYVLAKILKASWFTSLYGYYSANLTLIYLAQWIIIPWVMICFPEPAKEYPFYVCAAASLAFAALAGLAVKLYLKFFKKPNF